jgi:ElaB/YqjD/DUF883 family membrane-anchored ribosome-binding protein
LGGKRRIDISYGLLAVTVSAMAYAICIRIHLYMLMLAGAVSVSPIRSRSDALETPRQFQQLVSDVEELLERLDDEHGPQLDKMRARVEATMAEAKSALTSQGRSTAAQVRRYAGIADDYITGYPRAAFASGILLGALFGFLLASTRSDD